MEVQRINGTVISLPDNILFQIFVKLPMKDLGQCALVCKSWRNLSHDSVLWRYLDFRPFHLSIPQVHAILDQRCSDALKTLAIAGENFQPSSISGSFFNYLTDNFSNLTFLRLEAFNLAFVSLKTFPPTLKRLEILNCMFDKDFFDVVKTEKVFPKLEYLDISLNSGLTDEHLERISHIKSLSTVIAKQNHNLEVTDLGAQYLGRMKNIDCLDIANTGITDQGVEVIVAALPKLRKLNFSMLKLTNLAVSAVGNYSKKLEMLILNQVWGVSNIMPLVDLPLLTYLNVNNTSVEKETCLDFRKQKPMCIVEFKFERYLKTRAGSAITVNDGRFCI